MNKAPGYFHRQIEEKKKQKKIEIDLFTQQLEILVTALTLTDILINCYNNKLYYVLKENQLKPM